MARSKKNSKKKEKSIFGHRPGTQSAVMDEMILKGTTIEKMEKRCKVTRQRVLGHIKHLQVEKGIEIEIEGDVFKASTTTTPTRLVVEG